MTILRHVLCAGICALAVAATSGTAAAAGTNDRPSAGRFTGEHSFNGSISLTFERERGIGLYLAQYRVRGTQRCPSGEEVPIDEGGRVTARTAARVKSDRSFRLRTVIVRLSGRYVSSRRVRGSIEIRTSACQTPGTFTATRRR